MPWSGGTFSRVHDWTTDAGGAINIEADRMDAEDNNLRDGINDCLHKGGQNSATGNLPMAGNVHTGVGNAAARDQYASAADLQDQDLIFGLAGGAADAYTLTLAPAITAYEDGQRFVFRANANNTGASTLAVSGLAAKAIRTADDALLTGGELLANRPYEVTYNGNSDRFILTSPDSITKAAEAITITAGAGLTGGGSLAANMILDIGAGTGISVAADSISTDDSAIVHDNLSGFLPDEHIAHSSITFTAGNGLSGGGTLAGNRTFALDFDELSLGGTLVGTDHLIASNGGVENRQLISSIPLSIFNNDAGWDANTAHLDDLAALAAVSGADQFMVSDGVGSWAYQNLPVTKLKTADTTRTTESLSADTHLTGFSIAANKTYRVTGQIDVRTGSASATVQLGLDVSQLPQQGSALYGFGTTGSGTDAVSGGSIEVLHSFVEAGGFENATIKIDAQFLSHATLSGTLDLDWQESASGEITFNEGSYLRVEQLD